MNSKIFTGKIKHRRYWPVDHDLSYPVYLYAFDLDEFSGLNRRYPLFGYNKLFCFVFSLFKLSLKIIANVP